MYAGQQIGPVALICALGHLQYKKELSFRGHVWLDGVAQTVL